MNKQNNEYNNSARESEASCFIAERFNKQVKNIKGLLRLILKNQALLLIVSILITGNN